MSHEQLNGRDSADTAPVTAAVHTPYEAARNERSRRRRHVHRGPERVSQFIVAKLRGILATSAVSVAVVAGVSMALAPAASAYGPSYCNASSCSLAAGPYTWDIYFEMPRATPETMLCWTDTEWYDGTNRWFKVATVYGVGYTIANQVSHQTQVGHC